MIDQNAGSIVSPLAGGEADIGRGRWQGIAWMLLATVMLTANHAAIRGISGQIHPFEVTFFRNLVGLVILLPVIIPGRFAVLRTRRIGGHFVRSLFNAGFMLTYFMGLSLVPIADATALGFTGPIIAVFLAGLILKEKHTAARLAGLALGFAGVLIVVRPGLQAPNLGVALVLASSFFYGLVMVTIRDLTRTESSLTITAYMSVFLVPITLLPALHVWIWPDMTQVLFLCGIGIFATLGQIALSQASRHAELAAIMPLDFLRMVWASLIGVFLFDDTLQIAVIMGSVLIFAGALTALIGASRKTG